VISFPNVKAGQALISAIAIASLDKRLSTVALNSGLIHVKEANTDTKMQYWLDTGDKVYSDDEAKFVSLPSNLYSATSLQFAKNENTEKLTFTATENIDVSVAIPTSVIQIPNWLANFEETGSFIESTYQNNTAYKVLRKRLSVGEELTLGKISPTAHREAETAKAHRG